MKTNTRLDNCGVKGTTMQTAKCTAKAAKYANTRAEYRKRLTLPT